MLRHPANAPTPGSPNRYAARVQSETETLVLALASELTAVPRLLHDWRRVIGDGPARLLIYPDQSSAHPDPRLASSLVGSTTDRRPPIRATALTEPLSDGQERTLLHDCAGFYGDAELPSTVRGLVRLQIDDVASRLALAGRHYDVTLVGGGYRIQHRGSTADRGVLVQVFQLEEYSFEPLSPWLSGFPRLAAADAGKAPLIVDCGANIGASVVYFAKTFPDAHIVALEPEPDNFSLLVLNAAPFGDRVTAWNEAIASTSGPVRLTDPGLGEWGYRTGAAAEGTLLAEVAAVTIDDVLDRTPGTQPFALKVDIEGAEEDLFTARGATLDLFPVVVIELHDWMSPGAHVSVPFLRWHQEHGREMRVAGENFFSLAASLAG